LIWRNDISLGNSDPSDTEAGRAAWVRTAEMNAKAWCRCFIESGDGWLMRRHTSSANVPLIETAPRRLAQSERIAA
jgi:hypothetical protein